MNQPGKKLQPKLGLDMPFDEALARFVQTDAAELKEAIDRSKDAASAQEAPNEPPPRHKVRRKRH